MTGHPFEKKYLYQGEGHWGHRKFLVGVDGHVPVLIVVMILRVIHVKKLSSYTLSMCLKVKVKATKSCLSLQSHRLYSPWNSPGQNTGVGSLSPLQVIFPTHGLNPGLPHCRWILYQLSHKRSFSLVQFSPSLVSDSL